MSVQTGVQADFLDEAVPVRSGHIDRDGDERYDVQRGDGQEICMRYAVVVMGTKAKGCIRVGTVKGNGIGQESVGGEQIGYVEGRFGLVGSFVVIGIVDNLWYNEETAKIIRFILFKLLKLS